VTVNSIQQNAKTAAIEVSAMPNGQKSIYSFNNLFHLLCTGKPPRCSCEDRRDITCFSNLLLFVSNIQDSFASKH
jgi:hypothetical protein